MLSQVIDKSNKNYCRFIYHLINLKRFVICCRLTCFNIIHKLASFPMRFADETNIDNWLWGEQGLFPPLQNNETLSIIGTFYCVYVGPYVGLYVITSAL